LVALLLCVSTYCVARCNAEYGKLPSKKMEGRAEEVCTTAECTLSAAAIIEAMDLTADPCDDFFRFACGGWIDSNPVPESSSRWSQFNVLRVELSNALSGILESPVSVDDALPINQAKWLYNACMDEAAVEVAGVTPLTDLLAGQGGWPLTLSGWDAAAFDWQVTVADARNTLGQGSFLSVFVFADERDTFNSALYIDQTSLGMPRSILVQPDGYVERFNAYRSYINDTAHIIAASLNEVIDEATLAGQIDAMVNFEMSLANITTASEDRREIDRMYNPMTVAELDAITPAANIDWVTILNAMFANAGVAIDSTTRVIVMEVEYIKQFSQLIASTDEEVLSNYLLWRYVQDLADETNAAMRNAEFQYESFVYGTTAPNPRNEECADKTNSLMGMAVGYPYVQQYFSEQAKNESNYLVEDLRSAFKDLLAVNEWMDDETKPLAVEKADAISKFIGYPDWYAEPTGLDDFYATLTDISDVTTHFDNIAASRYWWSISELDDFGQPTDRNQWFSPPTIVNAFYLPEFNSITFPAGILQPPFYRANTLQAINYGSIGHVMGHEITHGFDDQGSQNDKNGNAIPWWTNATLAAFSEKAQCIIDQYSAYRIPEIDYLLPNATINGVTTQGENIADCGGLREAYLAYQQFTTQYGVEPRLPGLDQYTPNQIFFLANANIWCAAITDEALLNQVLTDPHSPEKFRVLGPMSNMAEFGNEWNCTLGSTYNPVDKCIVW